MVKLYTTLRIGDRDIPVYVEHKRIRNAYARFRDGAIYVTCSSTTFSTTINELCSRLIKRLDKKGLVGTDVPITEDYYYLFGEKYPLIHGNSLSRVDRFLRKELSEYLNERVRYYERLMGIVRTYSISIRKMNARYGSNGYKAHNLTFAYKLVHFSKEIIDGVIVHELAHEFQRNHSKDFYSILLRFYPMYKITDKYLKKGAFKYE